jgi:RHS repeat-associated protein
LAAKYLYDTYGNTLATYGSLATANRYRFSSKEWNENSGLYYYLFRFYDPNLQRWLNRDPIGEFGGNNLYEFAFDNPVSKVDSYGLDCANDCENQYQRDQQKIKHDYEVCLAWYYGILTGNQCLARPRPPLTPPAILGGLSGCGAKAAAAQTAATARLAGCLSGCPSSSCFIAPAPPLPPHDPGQCPNTGNAPWGI